MWQNFCMYPVENHFLIVSKTKPCCMVLIPFLVILEPGSWKLRYIHFLTLPCCRFCFEYIFMNNISFSWGKLEKVNHVCMLNQMQGQILKNGHGGL